jgi:alkanesulfonate monooxygenase SsuD/methylene tetrahydromethanopterin reductase-like flavin-dependent oxidoreductase (luciferase family)
MEASIELGVDSFAAVSVPDNAGRSAVLRDLIDEIAYADEVGLDAFGIGEHHRHDFLDSAPVVILGAAAARTSRIRLHSAVTVLSAADPVRVFQQFATLDLISNGRAEIVAGRGSFIEAFPLFGLALDEYDALFEEKLDLLLKLRENEHLDWSGNSGRRSRGKASIRGRYNSRCRFGAARGARPGRSCARACWACR